MLCVYWKASLPSEAHVRDALGEGEDDPPDGSNSFTKAMSYGLILVFSRIRGVRCPPFRITPFLDAV